MFDEEIIINRQRIRNRCRSSAVLSTWPAGYRRLVFLFALLVIGTPTAAGGEGKLSVEGTEFVLMTSDGRVLRSMDLVGARIRFGTLESGNQATIESVERDGPIFLHHFTIRGHQGAQTELCTPDTEGRSLGFPVDDGHGGFELTCTSGAVGKCIRWGYHPWEERSGGPPLRALHEACVRMVRADYGGDDNTATRDGTFVYFCDRFGVKPCGENPPFEFEAAWGVAGATCVARPRIPILISLDHLLERYPRLKGRVGASCTEKTAFTNGAALLLNRSAANKP